MIVMPRCDPLPRSEWEHGVDYISDSWWLGTDGGTEEGFSLCDLVEDKYDSFGLLNGKIVAVDYG
jgi:hypothetical protein